MTDPWSADFDDLRVFSLAMQNEQALSVCLSVCTNVKPPIEDFLATVLTIFTSLFMFDRVNHSKSIVITTESHHSEETFMLAHRRTGRQFIGGAEKFALKITSCPKNKQCAPISQITPK